MIEGPLPRRYEFDAEFEAAPTILESLFWGWMMGAPLGFQMYVEELMITDLRGPGHIPDDFKGEAST